MRMTLPEFVYKGDSAKTEAGRLRGYFTVGDIGYLDADGFLFLCDRKSDMIISGGANIYPAEIEAAIIMHPKVADVAVFGIPDDEWGESVKAVVEPLDGAQAGPDLAADILASLEGRLSRMKWPRSIDFIGEMPRDPTGKLLKRRLRTGRAPAARSEAGPLAVTRRPLPPPGHPPVTGSPNRWRWPRRRGSGCRAGGPPRAGRAAGRR
jgi:long-chain acyl-CoA synthetase